MNNSGALATRLASASVSVRPAGDVAARSVRAAALTLIGALPLIANPWGPDAYAGAKVLALYGLTALMLAAWAIAYAVSGRPSWRATAPELAVWAFGLAVLASSAVSANPRLTIFGAPGRHEGVLAVTAYAALFFIGAQFFGSASGLRRLAAAAGAGAVVVIGYGLAQMVLPPWFDGEAIIRSWYGSMGLPRIFSTLGSPIVFGGYLTVVTPLLLALALRESPTGAPWLAVAVAGYAAALITSTRAAWIALAIATAVFFALAGRMVWRRHRSALAMSGVAASAVMAFLLMTAGGATPFVDRAASAVIVQAGSVGQRVYIWDQTLRLVRQRPLLGWGLETLREVFPYDRPSLQRQFGLRPVIIDKAHNDVLQVAVSIGLPGAAAFVAVWGLVIFSAYRVWRHTERSQRVLAAGCVAAFAGYLMQAQFSFSTVALAPLVWLLAGAVAGWDAVEGRHGRNDAQ